MMSALELSHQLNGRRCGDAFIARCPAHDDQKPSLHIWETDDGVAKVHCYAGCAPSDVWRIVRGFAPATHLSTDHHKLESNSRWHAELVLDTWRASRSIQPGDPAQTYLLSRSLPIRTIPAVLRYHPHCYVSGVEGVRYLPAMVARVDSPDGEIVAIHRTYLTADGGKASIQGPKRMLSIKPGAMSGGAVRLFQPGEQLGVAEGIETSIACNLATGIPTWSTCTAGGMERFVIPPTVSELVIFADNDAHKQSTGQRAGLKLAERALGQGFRVRLIVSPTPGRDWLDEFLDNQ